LRRRSAAVAETVRPLALRAYERQQVASRDALRARDPKLAALAELAGMPLLGDDADEAFAAALADYRAQWDGVEVIDAADLDSDGDRPSFDEELARVASGLGRPGRFRVRPAQRVVLDSEGSEVSGGFELVASAMQRRLPPKPAAPRPRGTARVQFTAAGPVITDAQGRRRDDIVVDANGDLIHRGPAPVTAAAASRDTTVERFVAAIERLAGRELPTPEVTVHVQAPEQARPTSVRVETDADGAKRYVPVFEGREPS
jgi:hypothetical protein